MPGRKPAGDELFVARQSFATVLDGVTLIIQQGQVVDARDPLLKQVDRKLFEPFAPRIRKYAGQVEQATAAPGEKRNR